ncbi:peptidyl-prolyl cis-trans isomerase, cyclophilin-type protein (macronuclear) [Tetrahymena thermophila SB210]|uniref:Peptidyl-prolyl cis-trans isomerase, cyclophilin-type protein n=1 Tax=Tetrahymena thermophila (strain SB210) TaxID=312017 RepID=I7LWV2_TETTS|nr:peptidyl-prolyl cis-trans isomerase, cyclophilin-type protein [Tetrahymena thermophila SB210]EAS02919.2 peptidyl-prolyl cis-trans isomerase, cyclophilin-type protein [Tetrahymena thermophila SB210]|eukprot:XP_001023164.2 peptidyl-prolyl cis-trans isomerase, cyclophilin-type protein [Tetrahymena thermophila SB210]
MSSVYSLEPPTSGKVIIRTSMGDIDVELWTLEAPKACRNFIQLCLEGYYDDTIFHRLIPKFMIQGGDPTGTGKGGESIYGEPFKDEFHQRLKFSHRGIVAMANESKPNTNTSQFFITFDECTWLDKKHTIFGKVTGDSVYNLLQLQQVETDQNDRPLNPPRIIKTNVVQNPFDDIVLRSDQAIKFSKLNQNKDQKYSSGSESEEDEEEQRFKIENEKRKKEMLIQKQKEEEQKKKNFQNKNLLSFADDDEEEEDGIEENGDDDEKEEGNNKNSNKDDFKKPQDKCQIMNIHDISEEDKFSKETAVDIENLQKKKQQIEEEENKKKRLQDRVKSAKQDGVKEEINKKLFKENEVIEVKGKLAEENKDLLNYKKRINKQTGKVELYWDNEGEQSKSESDQESYSSTDSEDYQNEEEKKIRQKQKEEYENLRISFLQQKRDGQGTASESARKNKSENNKLLTNVEKRRQKYLEKEQLERRQGGYMKKLAEFQQKMKVVSNPNSWVKHELRFQATGDRAFQIFDAKEKIKEYNVNEDLEKKGYVNKSLDNLKRNIEKRQEESQKRVGEKLTVEELMKLADE